MSDLPVDRALKWLLEEVICSRGVMRLFDMKAALIDVENLYALKKGSVEEDELNVLTGLWAKKIQYAIDKQNDSDNEGSDEEESE